MLFEHLKIFDLNLGFEYWQELAASKAVMVSTGGGVVTREQNWESMRHGLVIWLTGPPELLAKRAVSDGTQSRPLLSQGSSGHTSEV